MRARRTCIIGRRRASPSASNQQAQAQSDRQKIDTRDQFHYDDGYYRNVKVWNDRAYVVDARRGLVVLDITSELPTTTWIQSRGAAYGLHLEQGLPFVAANEHWNRLP